jgi:hypothetical protein
MSIDAVATQGRKRGWSIWRWITAEDNARARALYDLWPLIPRGKPMRSNFKRTRHLPLGQMRG